MSTYIRTIKQGFWKQVTSGKAYTTNPEPRPILFAVVASWLANFGVRAYRYVVLTVLRQAAKGSHKKRDYIHWR